MASRRTTPPAPPGPAPAARSTDQGMDGLTDGRTDERTAGRAGAQTPPRPPGSQRGSPLGSGRGFHNPEVAGRRDPSSGALGRASPARFRAGFPGRNDLDRGRLTGCSPICPQILCARGTTRPPRTLGLGAPSGGRSILAGRPRAVRPGQRPASEIQPRSRRGDAGSPALGPQRGRWGVEADCPASCLPGVTGEGQLPAWRLGPGLGSPSSRRACLHLLGFPSDS